MSAEDEAIWQRYLPTIANDFDFMYFDVGLGEGASAPESASPEYKRMWKINTQKRADVILETKDAWTIIELRNIATSSAIGRLLLYKTLWNADPPDARPLQLRLITNGFDADVQHLCEVMDIHYQVV